MALNINLNKIQEDLYSETGDISEWCESQYDELFSSYFSGIPELYRKITSNRSKISDDDLEWVLTDTPLKLIAVSEQLSQYKLNCECLKVYIKKKELEYIETCDEANTISKKRELASLYVIEYKLLLKAYGAVIDRVEGEVTFSKELIMSAKKIWDARKKAYEGSPVSSIEPDLPDYTS